MIKSFFGRLWAGSWSMVLGEIGAQEARWLFSARNHPTRLTARRAGTIVSRVRLGAGVFALLTPLWMIIDFFSLPPAIWQEMIPMRLLTLVAFVAIVAVLRGMHTLREAYRALFFLLAIPSAFYLYSYLHVWMVDADGVLEDISVGYAYLPFIMVAGLSIFPLTVFESASFAALLLLVQIVSFVPSMPGANWPMFLGSFSMLLVLAGVSNVAGLSQLTFMIALASEGIHDSLTGCYSRRCGEELLDLQYIWSARTDTGLAVGIVDLDDFNEVNLRFGYDFGDKALKDAAETIHDKLRAGDLLVRWAGNQFLLAMPKATADQASAAMKRLLANGLGARPDQKPLTASVGIAERKRDSTEDWWKLVDAADARAKAAGNAGGNQVVAP